MHMHNYDTSKYLVCEIVDIFKKPLSSKPAMFRKYPFRKLDINLPKYLFTETVYLNHSSVFFYIIKFDGKDNYFLQSDGSIFKYSVEILQKIIGICRTRPGNPNNYIFSSVYFSDLLIKDVQIITADFYMTVLSSLIGCPFGRNIIEKLDEIGEVSMMSIKQPDMVISPEMLYVASSSEGHMNLLQFKLLVYHANLYGMFANYLKIYKNEKEDPYSTFSKYRNFSSITNEIPLDSIIEKIE